MKERQGGQGSPEQNKPTSQEITSPTKEPSGRYKEARARFRQERQSWYDWYKRTYNIEEVGSDVNINSNEQSTKRKRKKMFTYSEEERKAFTHAWFRDRDTWGLRMADYYERYEQSHKKELEKAHVILRQATVDREEEEYWRKE